MARIYKPEDHEVVLTPEYIRVKLLRRVEGSGFLSNKQRPSQLPPPQCQRPPLLEDTFSEVFSGPKIPQKINPIPDFGTFGGKKKVKFAQKFWRKTCLGGFCSVPSDFFFGPFLSTPPLGGRTIFGHNPMSNTFPASPPPTPAGGPWPGPPAAMRQRSRRRRPPPGSSPPPAQASLFGEPLRIPGGRGRHGRQPFDWVLRLLHWAVLCMARKGSFSIKKPKRHHPGVVPDSGRWHFPPPHRVLSAKPAPVWRMRSAPLSQPSPGVREGGSGGPSTRRGLPLRSS